MVGLPAGFALAVLGPNLSLALAGQAVFGLFLVTVYYAALYYAMVVKNAAVDAGGWHEALIGFASIAGPTFGLLGLQFAGAAFRGPAGTLVGMTPLMVVCLLIAVKKIMSPLTGAAGTSRRPGT